MTNKREFHFAFHFASRLFIRQTWIISGRASFFNTKFLFEVLQGLPSFKLSFHTYAVRCGLTNGSLRHCDTAYTNRTRSKKR